MTLFSQIKEARKALQELTTDEVELARLLAEQEAGIQALKGGGSKDFEALSPLEGDRTRFQDFRTLSRRHCLGQFHRPLRGEVKSSR